MRRNGNARVLAALLLLAVSLPAAGEKPAFAAGPGDAIAAQTAAAGGESADVGADAAGGESADAGTSMEEAADIAADAAAA